MLTFIEQPGKYNLNTEAVRFDAVDGNKHSIVFSVSREALEDLERRSNCTEAELVDIYQRNINLIRQKAKQKYLKSPGGFDPYVLTSDDINNENSTDHHSSTNNPFAMDAAFTLDDVLEDYDDLTDDVINSRYEMFLVNLRQWFEFIENNRVFNPIVESLTANHDVKKWISQGQATISSIVGSGSLEWPKTKEGRLAMQLCLFKSFADGEYTIKDFCINFLYVEGGLPNMVDEVVTQYFRPASRDLRKIFRKQIETNTTTQSSTSQAPAADRIVSLDHNSRTYIDAIEALNKCRDEFAQSRLSDNDPEFKRRTLAELDASNRLLKEKTVNADVVKNICISTLSNLISKFLETSLSKIAQTAKHFIELLIDQ
ncbi:MAG: DUF1488 family protein [Alphaproteobacteria bacterium]